MENQLEWRIKNLEEQAKKNPTQRRNIEAIISYYQEGGKWPQSGRDIVYAFDGCVKYATLDQFAEDLKAKIKHSTPWYEISGTQMGQWPESGHQNEGNKPLEPKNTIQVPGGYLQMAESMVCPAIYRGFMHVIEAQFRILQYLGGDENNVVTALIYNDTGPEVQTIYQHQFDQLDGPAPGRLLLRPLLVPIMTPNGMNNEPSATFELRIIKRDADRSTKALTDWMIEIFVLRDWNNGQPILLSGLAMRQRLYFATAPGNNELFVSVKKNGIVSRLPAI